MNPEFWKNRWQTKDTPWQQQEPESLLVNYLPKHKNQNVFVPLCGKSIDLLWLKKEGHNVIGVELSDIACRSFFEESKLDYQVQVKDGFQIFESQDIKIFCGNFFDLKADHLPKLDLIYDRAALIALPEDLRKKYVSQISALAKTNASARFQMLLIAYEAELKHEGPPFQISVDELHKLYGDLFTIEILEVRKRSIQRDLVRNITETACRLRMKAHGKYKIFVDGECRLCSKEASFIRKNDLQNLFELIDISAPEFRAEDFGFSKAEANRMMHMKCPDGRILKGIPAFIEIYRHIPKLCWLASIYAFPPVFSILKIFYRIFAANRHLLPKRNTSVFCEWK